MMTVIGIIVIKNSISLQQYHHSRNNSLACNIFNHSIFQY